MFFLATPHRGSDFAAILNNILKPTMVLTPRAYIADLEKNSPTLQVITDEFVKYADHLQIWSFYETLKTKISAIHSAMIVEPKSAILGKTIIGLDAPSKRTTDYYVEMRNERVQLLNADHRTICKFKSKSDPNYIAVRNALVVAIEELIGDGMNQLLISSR